MSGMIQPRKLLASPLWVLQDLFGADRVKEVNANSSIWRVTNRRSFQKPEFDFLDATARLVHLLRTLFPQSELSAGDSPRDMEVTGSWIEIGRQRWLLPDDANADALVSEWLIYDSWSLCWPARASHDDAEKLRLDPDNEASVQRFMAARHLAYLLWGMNDAEYLVFAVDPKAMRIRLRELFGLA